MSEQTYTTPTDESIDACELTRAERNRFFHGKLMTARDMAAEQTYHRRLVTRLAQRVTGYGVVDGLEATVDRVDEGLSVTVEAGFAIDCCGRPVVVPKDTTVEIGTDEVPEADRLGLVLEYAECVTESVPVPGSEDACERECAYNRVVETFDLRVEGAPEDGPIKPVPPIDFPESDAIGDEGVDPDDSDRLAEIHAALEDAHEAREAAEENGDEARATELAHHIEELEHELTDALAEVGDAARSTGAALDPQHPELARIAATWDPTDVPVGCGPEGTHRISLGSFAPPDSDAEPVDIAFRPRVYTNDMLYAAIARHTADFGNPHDVTARQAGALVSVKGVAHPGGDVDLVSPDEHIDFTTEPDVVGAHTIGLSVPGLSDVEDELQDHVDDHDNPHEVTAEQTGALVSVKGVENPGGDVDLASPDETIAFTTDPDDVGANTVGLSVPALADFDEGFAEHLTDFENPHQVTAAQVGALDSVAGVEGDDGDVGLVSPDETVSVITEDERVGDHEIGLSVTGLAELEDRVSQLERRHERDIAELTERVIRVEHYVMERSVWVKCRTFGLLKERFDRLRAADRVMIAAGQFLDSFEAGERVDPGAYLDYIDGSIELQGALFEELEEQGANLRRIQPAFDELQMAHENSDEKNVLPVARAQNKVCELLRCIHPLVID